MMSAIQHFSAYEVIRAAMNVEKNGHRFYSSMAERSTDPLVAELFSWLAQDEVEHLRRLTRLEQNLEEGGAWDDEEFIPYLSRFRDSEIFPSAERLDQVLSEPDSDIRVLELALEAEQAFAEYFRKAQALADSEEGQTAFAWLAAEEERHARIIGERRDQISQNRR